MVDEEFGMKDATNKSGGKAQSEVGWSNLIWPAMLVIFAVYRLTNFRRLSIPMIVWFSIVAGIGVLLVLLLAFAKVAQTLAGGAKEIDDLNRRLYSRVHQRQAADESTIRSYGLDRNFYQQTTETLTALGFRRFQDFVDVDAAKAMPQARAVIRAFASADQTIAAGVYDLRFGGYMRIMQWFKLLERDFRTIDLESELTDGSFVTTSSGITAAKALEFPGISRRFVARGSAPADVLAAHQQHLRSVMLANPQATPVRIQSFEDLCASQDRLQVIKSQHRNSAAYDPAEQLARIADKPLNPEQQELADEAARLHAERVREEAEREQA